jgi:hypothetical protein
MGSALVKWQLKRVGARLQAMRAELQIIDEQRMYLVDEADDLGLRAIVTDSPLSRVEARDAGGHAAAIGNARSHVAEQIYKLEARQDALLDRLSSH